MFNISYANEISLPIPERRQKGVNYISTSLKDIENDNFLSVRFNNKQDCDVIIDNRSMLFDRQNRNVLKANVLGNSIYEIATQGRDVEPLIRQFAAVDLGETKVDDLIKVVEQVTLNLQDNLNALSTLVGSVLALLIPFKRHLFKAEHKIVFYIGMLTKEYAILLHVLSNLGYDIIYVNNFVNDSEYRYDWIRKPVVEFHADNNVTNVSNTLSFNAQQEIRQILDDNLIRRENKTGELLEISPLRCTLDEIKMYYDTPVKFRPCFEKTDSKVLIPNLVGIIQGNCADYMRTWILPMVKEFECTVFYTPNKARPPVTSGERYNQLISRDEITLQKLSSLGIGNLTMLNSNIAEHVLRYINEKFKTLKTRTEMLNYLYRVLNLPDKVIRFYNNFILTEKNPKLVSVLMGNLTDKFHQDYDFILFDLLIHTGWDVLIFSPQMDLSSVSIYAEMFPYPVYNLGLYKEYDFADGDSFSVRNFLTKTNYYCPRIRSDNYEDKICKMSDLSI